MLRIHSYHLGISHTHNYSEEILMLVISDTTDYATRVPLLLPLYLKYIKHLDEIWKQIYVKMSCVAQQKKSQDGDPIDNVKGHARLKKK